MSVLAWMSSRAKEPNRKDGQMNRQPENIDRNRTILKQATISVLNNSWKCSGSLILAVATHSFDMPAFLTACRA